MKKLKATKGFCLGGGRDVHPGDVFEASDRDAQTHFHHQRAVEADEKDIKAFNAKAKSEAETKKQQGGA